jgi:hypothetical protein
MYVGKVILVFVAIFIVMGGIEARYRQFGRGASASKNIVKKFKDSQRLGKLTSWSLKGILSSMSLARSMYLLDKLEKITDSEDEETLKWLQE